MEYHLSQHNPGGSGSYGGGPSALEKDFLETNQQIVNTT